jgi:hypothetical protein
MGKRSKCIRNHQNGTALSSTQAKNLTDSPIIEKTKSNFNQENDSMRGNTQNTNNSGGKSKARPEMIRNKLDLNHFES